MAEPCQSVPTEPCLVFALNGYFYALPADWVCEVVAMPALTVLATAAPDVVGVFELRGELLPVLDLRLRLNLPCDPYQPSDGVMVLAVDHHRFGLIFNEVYDVCQPDTVHGNPLLQAEQLSIGLPEPLLLGNLQVGVKVAALVNLRALLDTTSVPLPGRNRYVDEDFFVNVAEKHRAIFAARAELLRQRPAQVDSGDHLALAVVLLGGEHFGIELLAVREFADIGDIVPIPCTPEHVLGCINLRGKVITLVDIRQAMHLPLKPCQPGSKAVVANAGDEFAVAFIVDQVLEVIYADRAQMTPLPASAIANETYLLGELPYRNQLLTLLNLPQILAGGELAVEEEI